MIKARYPELISESQAWEFVVDIAEMSVVSETFGFG